MSKCSRKHTEHHKKVLVNEVDKLREILLEYRRKVQMLLPITFFDSFGKRVSSATRISTVCFFPIFFLVLQKGQAGFFGIEIDILISVAVGILSVFLFIVSFNAYKKDGRQRLLFVTLAFFVFAVKGFLPALDEIFSLGLEPFELIAQILDFAILMLFFLGLVKDKEKDNHHQSIPNEAKESPRI
jgi:hypothetical protein